MIRKESPSTLPIIYPLGKTPETEFHDKGRPLESVAEILEWEEDLRGEFAKLGKTGKDDRLQEIWFRGTWKHFPLCPGIYRDYFGKLATDGRRDWRYTDNPLPEVSELELARLNLEREMLDTFRLESGPLMQYRSPQELYFTARHYGMPSRLLDWSISPLIALFMCVFPETQRAPRRSNILANHKAKGTREEHGVLYAMDPVAMKPEFICLQDDPMVKDAIEVITRWKDPVNKGPTILPVRPHTLPGRIDRQMSRFTLHPYGAQSKVNQRLRARLISSRHKEQIRCQLERMGINEFSVYYTLDRLASDIIDRFS